MQKLDEVEAEEMIPGLEGATDYYAMVNYGGRQVLAKLDGGKWRVVQQSEMMSILGANGINPGMLNPMGYKQGRY